MKSKKIIKTLAVMMLSVMVLNGVETVNPMNDLTSPKIAYAETQTLGLQTTTGVISGKVKYTDKIPQNATLEELKAISISVVPTKNPEFFSAQMTTGTMLLSPSKIYVSNNIYHHEYYDNDLGLKFDDFYHVYEMKIGSEGKVIKNYSKADYVNGSLATKEIYSSEYTDSKAYNYILNEDKTEEPKTEEPKTEEPKTEEPNKPEIKTYSSTRLGGSTRWETATAIAKQVSSNKLDSVILANAYNFPDALSGTTLAGQKNAPILLVGNNEYDKITFNYLKANLKSNGKIYVLGGNGVVTDSTLSKVKELGFNNIKRLGGSDRYATNISIINEINAPKGTDIVIANANSYADSLAISGVAGGKNMPIFLVDNTLTSTMINKIKSIAPKNIYIVGDTGVVNSNIEKQLKSYGSVVRLGGLTRYETSLEIANYFTNTTQTTIAIAYSHDFPDALTGGALASKTSSPVLLVNKDVTAQKKFLDNTKINKLYILGGTGVINDDIVNKLKK